MRLVNHLNEVLEIRVNKYTYENSVNSYFDNDALDATLIIEKGDGHFERELKFMTVEQIELMDEWLTMVSTSKGTLKTLNFVDVDLEFMKSFSGNTPHIKIVLSDLYEEWTKTPISWDFIINKKNVHLMGMELQKTMKEFPCRCGMKHDCHKL
ncbi:hypothetical protein [Flavobacterium sp.]|uniref:WapI family immunity protein n=1 Tax=Flavobacterium sp. TaxID=239 RepID=UPI0037503A5D